jgi:hypothetical protein
MERAAIKAGDVVFSGGSLRREKAAAKSGG